MKRFPLKSPASQNGGAGKDRVHQTGRVSLNQPLGGITTQQEGKGVIRGLSSIVCLHNSVSCIGILSLSDCNASPLWTEPSARAASDFSMLSGKEATPGSSSALRGESGRRLPPGGVARGGVLSPWVSWPSSMTSPFGNSSALTWPKTKRRDSAKSLH